MNNGIIICKNPFNVEWKGTACQLYVDNPKNTGMCKHCHTFSPMQDNMAISINMFTCEHPGISIKEVKKNASNKKK